VERELWNFATHRIGLTKDSSVNYRFNLLERTAFLLPLPLAGEGWGGGPCNESEPWKCPLPDPYDMDTSFKFESDNARNP
jgi:hypothetical protein